VRAKKAIQSLATFVRNTNNGGKVISEFVVMLIITLIPKIPPNPGSDKSKYICHGDTEAQRRAVGYESHKSFKSPQIPVQTNSWLQHEKLLVRVKKTLQFQVTCLRNTNNGDQVVNSAFLAF
jgi:hypothetical protein